jgi:hypothetical protein
MSPNVPADTDGERRLANGAPLHEDGLTRLALQEGNLLPPHLHLHKRSLLVLLYPDARIGI